LKLISGGICKNIFEIKNLKKKRHDATKKSKEFFAKKKCLLCRNFWILEDQSPDQQGKFSFL